MKIRTGFVSNSSTTSFMIIGVEIEKEDIQADKLVEIVSGFSLADAEKTSMARAKQNNTENEFLSDWGYLTYDDNKRTYYFGKRYEIENTREFDMEAIIKLYQDIRGAMEKHGLGKLSLFVGKVQG